MCAAPKTSTKKLNEDLFEAIKWAREESPELLDTVRRLLAEGADATELREEGYTNYEFALMLAVIREYEGCIRAMFETGVNMNACDDYGWTSLHFAANVNKFKLVNLLLELGANPSATSTKPRHQRYHDYPAGATPADVASSAKMAGVLLKTAAPASMAAPKTPAGSSKKTAWAHVSCSEPKLEAAILAAPQDESNFRAYAEWLKGQNDPRSELITLQLQANGASKAEQAAFEQQAQKLLKKYEPELLGPAAQKRLFDVTWRNGFIRGIRTKPLTKSIDPDEMLQQFEALLRHPSSRFASELLLNASKALPVNELLKRLENSLPLLERVGIWRLGDQKNPDESSISLLNQVAPKVQRLVLDWNRLDDLAGLRLPELRELAVGTQLDGYVAKAFSQRAWPGLQRLFFGTEDLTSNGTALRSFMAAKLPGVRVLQIKRLSWNEEVLDSLVHWSPFKQLEEAHLGLEGYNSRVLPWLGRNAKAFRHLKKLCLPPRIQWDLEHAVDSLKPHAKTFVRELGDALCFGPIEPPANALE